MQPFRCKLPFPRLTGFLDVWQVGRKLGTKNKVLVVTPKNLKHSISDHARFWKDFRSVWQPWRELKKEFQMFDGLGPTLLKTSFKCVADRPKVSKGRLNVWLPGPKLLKHL